MNTALKTALAVIATVASMAASAQHFDRIDTREIDARQAQPFARIDTRDIDARQARQEARIENGLARGDFTRREARILRQGQREIARAEARAKADGHVSRDEVRNLTAMLDQADAQIRQFRHDRDGYRPA